MSIDELPEEQLDHVLRFALCDSERQGDGETPRTWLQVPAVRLVCQHWAATHRQDQVLSPVGEALSHLRHASWIACERDRREIACVLEALVITPVVGALRRFEPPNFKERLQKRSWAESRTSNSYHTVYPQRLRFSPFPIAGRQTRGGSSHP